MRCVRIDFVVLGLAFIATGFAVRSPAQDQPAPTFSIACGAAVPASADAPLVSQKNDLVKAATEAVSESADLAQAATKTLREAGPAGLEALLSAHREAIEAHRGLAVVGIVNDAQWQ